MPKKNLLTCLRLDPTSIENLNDLSISLNSSKSSIMRRSICLMRQLKEIQKNHGHLKIITSTGEKILILIN